MRMMMSSIRFSLSTVRCSNFTRFFSIHEWGPFYIDRSGRYPGAISIDYNVKVAPSQRRFLSSSGSKPFEKERPYRILGVQQVAIGGEDRSALRRLWVDILGVSIHQEGVRIERENVVEDILSLDGVEIDLMTPIDPSKSPKVHIPPLNHVGLWVDDLELAVEWMQARGVRFTPGGIRTGAAGHKVVFIHPKANEAFPIAGNGVLVELVQAPESVISKSTNRP